MENKHIIYIGGGVCAADGFAAAGVHCGFRKNPLKKDLALIVSDVECNVAAVFTQNKIKGAPIAISKKNISDGKARAIICNSGNANTCAPNGIEIAQKACEITADVLNIKPEDIIVTSTGVIGKELEIEPFKRGIPQAAKKLEYDASEKAAQAIMTTDTVKKEVAVTFILDGKQCHLGAIAKGSGMIHPNMATMLCFATTDVSISSEMLQKALSDNVKDTFNQVSVDGDTSTNDTVAILANGMAGNTEICEDGKNFDIFCTALHMVTSSMAKCIAQDGEGATKVIECVVSGAPDKEIARIVSKSVITSSLFKAAMFGADANWGRALCAIGYADADFSMDDVDVTLSSSKGNIMVCKKSAYFPYSEEKASELLSENEIKVLVNLNQGDEAAAAWGCDLTYEYVKINGSYRS